MLKRLERSLTFDDLKHRWNVVSQVTDIGLNIGEPQINNFLFIYPFFAEGTVNETENPA